MLKNLLAILLLFSYLFSTTEFYQLLKIPVLAAHYIEHKHDSSNITLVQFLKIHYLVNSKDADYERDMQLPFKTQDMHLTGAFSVFVPLADEITIDHPVASIRMSSCLVQTRFISALQLADIWQPPRIC